MFSSQVWVARRGATGLAVGLGRTVEVGEEAEATLAVRGRNFAFRDSRAARLLFTLHACVHLHWHAGAPAARISGGRLVSDGRRGAAGDAPSRTYLCQRKKRASTYARRTVYGTRRATVADVRATYVAHFLPPPPAVVHSDLTALRGWIVPIHRVPPHRARGCVRYLRDDLNARGMPRAYPYPYLYHVVV